MRSVLAAALVPLAMLAAAPAASAQVATPAPGMQAITGTLLSVNAEGRSTNRPDMAVVTLGVTTQGATAAAALAENSRNMNALIASLRRSGVQERDIQTSNINLSPQYVYRENEAPRLTGYQANNTVTARVRNLNSVGAALDAAIAAGGNTLQGVNFTYQNPDAEMDRAREDAIRAARHRAELYARAAGLSVGRIVSISESGGYIPPMPMPVMMMRAQDAAANTPVAPGEVDSRISVSVIFELR